VVLTRELKDMLVRVGLSVPEQEVTYGDLLAVAEEDAVGAGWHVHGGVYAVSVAVCGVRGCVVCKGREAVPAAVRPLLRMTAVPACLVAEAVLRSAGLASVLEKEKSYLSLSAVCRLLEQQKTAAVKATVVDPVDPTKTHLLSDALTKPNLYLPKRVVEEVCKAEMTKKYKDKRADELNAKEMMNALRDEQKEKWAHWKKCLLFAEEQLVEMMEHEFQTKIGYKKGGERRRRKKEQQDEEEAVIIL